MRRQFPVLGIVLFLSLTVALLLAVPNALRYSFPAIAMITAAYLFVRSRTLYIQFCFWLWFLSPLLRRLVDWRTQFVDTSPLLLAPFLASAVSGVVLLRHLRALSRRELAGSIPFACAIAGILFGMLFGLTRYTPIEVGRGLINWLTPVFFGFFLYYETTGDPERLYRYRDTVIRSLLWGTLLLGIYGIIQFFVLPPWDESWMIGIRNGAFGQPFPRELRVFSTMNAPATFASYLMAGILVAVALLTQRGRALPSRLAVCAAPVGLIALALTTSRALWIGLVFGVIYLSLALHGRARVRVVASAIVVLALAAAAAQAPGIREQVVSRLQSFSSGANDVSYRARVDGHGAALAALATEPLGEGMGSTDVDHATDGSDDRIGPHDSTLLEFLFSLGGPGTLVYAIGMIAALLRIFLAPGDVQGMALRAAIFAFFSECLLNSILIGVPGFLVWTCLALLLAGCDRQAVRSERVTDRDRSGSLAAEQAKQVAHVG